MIARACISDWILTATGDGQRLVSLQIQMHLERYVRNFGPDARRWL